MILHICESVFRKSFNENVEVFSVRRMIRNNTHFRIDNCGLGILCLQYPISIRVWGIVSFISNRVFPQHGILLRVLSSTTMTASNLPVSAANIGLPLLATASCAAWNSTAMATSLSRATNLAVSLYLSVASKNNHLLIVRLCIK